MKVNQLTLRSDCCFQKLCPDRLSWLFVHQFVQNCFPGALVQSWKDQYLCLLLRKGSQSLYYFRCDRRCLSISSLIITANPHSWPPPDVNEGDSDHGYEEVENGGGQHEVHTADSLLVEWNAAPIQD